MYRLGVFSRVLAAAVLVTTGCDDRPEPTAALPDIDVRFAKGGSTGVAVQSVVPASSEFGITLSVQVNGSGFTAGSKATWALNGDTTFAVTRIKTNSTAFISSTQLVANITIEDNAALDLYDIVVVTPQGKKGIGIELFAVTPQFVDLGIGDGSFATSINENGQIVGHSGSSPGGFLWEDGSYQILVPLAPYSSATPDDINDSGAVVGQTGGAGLPTKAFLWTAGSGTQIVSGTLGGNTSEAHAVNNSGHIAGASATATGGYHATLWKDGSVIDLQLPNFPSGASYAWGMNDSDVVVGQYNSEAGATYAFRWTASTGMQLISATQSVAMRVNSAGVIVGALLLTDTQHAFRWYGGILEDLGTLGGKQSMALAINDLGEISGRAQAAGRRIPASILPFIWEEGSGMKAIPIPPGRQGGQAWAINDNGWAAGFAYTASGAQRATLWKLK